MIEGLTLTSGSFVQNRPIDGLDARKAHVAVAKQIREAILGGTYEPGARMRETELAERFKVSRSPVREAFPALEKEGTLEALPYRGAIVKPLSAQEALEIAGLRLALVSLAAKPAYPQLSPADFDLAEDIAVRLNQTQDPVEFFNGITGFWHTIFKKAQQPVLLEVLTQLESRATRYIPLFIRLFPDPEKRPRHREIFLEHYRKGKVAEAVQAFRKEYWKQTRSVIDHLSSSNGSAPGPQILARVGQVIDSEPPNSKRWADAARELRVISVECVRLARLTGDPDLIAEAERTAAILPPKDLFSHRWEDKRQAMRQ